MVILLMISDPGSRQLEVSSNPFISLFVGLSPRCYTYKVGLCLLYGEKKEASDPGMIREEFQIFKKYIILNFFLSANYSESA